MAVSHKALESTTAAPGPIVDWRRTRYGWQRIRVVEPTPRPAWFAVGAMHPSILAMFELTASLAALIAFASEKEITRHLPSPPRMRRKRKQVPCETTMA